MSEPLFDESSEGVTHHIVVSFTLDEVRAAASAPQNSLRVPVIQLIPYKERVAVLRLTNIGGIVPAEQGAGYRFVGCSKQLIVDTKHTHEFEATVSMRFCTTWCTIVVTDGQVGTMETFTFSHESEVTGSFPQDLPIF